MILESKNVVRIHIYKVAGPESGNMLYIPYLLNVPVQLLCIQLFFSSDYTHMCFIIIQIGTNLTFRPVNSI